MVLHQIPKFNSKLLGAQATRNHQTIWMQSSQGTLKHRQDNDNKKNKNSLVQGILVLLINMDSETSLYCQWATLRRNLESYGAYGWN